MALWNYPLRWGPRAVRLPSCTLAISGLPVRDEQRSQQFYSAYFGFDPATAQEYEDGTVIIRNADGFDLALHPAEHIEPSPAFLHVGFRAAEPADVRAAGPAGSRRRHHRGTQRGSGLHGVQVP